MESPIVPRQRLIRDYSTEEPTSPPRRQHSYDRDVRPPPPPAKDHKTVQIEQPESPEETLDLRKLDFSLSPVNEESLYEPSISTQPTSVSGRSNARLADFFGQEVFQIVLHNPTAAHQFRKFAHSRLCGENLDFLEKVDQYNHSLNQVTKSIFDIHRNFISVNSPAQVNLPEDVLIRINKNLKQLLATTMPSMESVFLAAQNDIEKLVSSDIYPRFVRHQMSMSATKALATNKNKYAGLGDCFVLTNPNKADNPIVYASDGFVNVTGYRRNEIIPRNCRFLQTRQTDPASVKRIKKSLTQPAECVELLLNERKNGEPFWNLLYTAPLYDATGKLAFFIGGQINVSTTIHSTSDILRTLSYNADEDNSESIPLQPPAAQAKTHRQSFFASLRKQKPTSTNQRLPGMEPELLDDLNQLPLKQQKEAFYSAYSKYIVVDATSMLIAFYSAGIMDLFYPSKGFSAIHNQNRERIVGQDVFKFLSYHSASGLSRDYKTRVKAALKASQAVTADVSLCTRRVTSFEKFATHWTPLKNDADVVGYVVLTLGSESEKDMGYH